MAKNKKVVAPISMPTEPVTVFEVSEDGGTLRLADHTEPGTRAEFYEDIADQWDASPQDLLDAAEACEPLAWAVNSLYQDFSDELIAKIEAAQSAERPNNKHLTALKAKLEELPEEPEEGATDWLLGPSWYAEGPSFMGESPAISEEANGVRGLFL